MGIPEMKTFSRHLKAYQSLSCSKTIDFIYQMIWTQKLHVASTKKILISVKITEKYLKRMSISEMETFFMKLNLFKIYPLNLF